MGSKTNFRGQGLYSPVSHDGRHYTIKDRQEQTDYDFIPQNIAGIERPSK